MKACLGVECCYACTSCRPILSLSENPYILNFEKQSTFPIRQQDVRLLVFLSNRPDLFSKSKAVK